MAFIPEGMALVGEEAGAAGGGSLVSKLLSAGKGLLGMGGKAAARDAAGGPKSAASQIGKQVGYHLIGGDIARNLGGQPGAAGGGGGGGGGTSPGSAYEGNTPSSPMNPNLSSSQFGGASDSQAGY